MKKQMKSIATLLATASLVWMGTSCAKTEEVAAPALVSAYVSGIVEADLDTAAALNKVPGALIVVSVTGTDLITNGSAGANVTKTYSAVTDGNGKYSIKVDMAKKKIDAKIKIQELVTDVKTLQSGSIKSTRTVFSSEERTITLVEGSSETEDFTLTTSK
jgi:hypothetical protein